MRSLRLGAAIAVLCGALPDVSGAQGIAPFDTAQTRLMGPAGFRGADFNLLINYRDEPANTLSTVDKLLRSPGSVDSLVPALRKSLSNAFENGMIGSFGLWNWLDAPFTPMETRAEPSVQGRLQGAQEALRAYLKPLSAQETQFLIRETPGLLIHQGDDTTLNAIESEVERLRGDALTDSVMHLAGKLPVRKLAEASDDLDHALDDILSSVKQNGIPRTIAMLQELKRKGFPVDIGGMGDDVHRLDRGIVFDPGGNDRYEFPDTVRPGSWLLVIDLAGDDTYRSTDSVGAAAGFLSAQIIADMGGNDHYLGRDLAFGSAVMGYSRLFDAAGDDLYEGRSASLGFAFYGVGILQDLAGNDVYSSYYLSQGAASTRGLGVLLDDAGNDQYLSRPAFVDDLRYRDHFLSLSQGFSTGFAPRQAGGIGVLWDRSGEDLYSADIFGQGAGYWFSWGLLMDDAGNDRFLAHQYAQGAGVHFAAGTLWDKAGNDVRVSKGVSQGCGHDGGFGMLVDESGDDRDFAQDMSLGAGSANGLGIYLDFAGDDFYGAGNPHMTLGHGDMRRDRGSSGFFLDLGGKDAYPPEFRDGLLRREYGGKLQGYGYGLDAP